MHSMRVRSFPENNYKSIFYNYKTMRLIYDSSKPIKELEYPEFYDISVTHKCNGKCPYCYQNSVEEGHNAENAVEKLTKFLGSMSDNEKPFQIAYGGGEPTLHPKFIDILKITHEMGIVPNYTTNGTNISNELIKATKKYSGGIALTCHPHLRKYWEPGIDKFVNENIRTFFHLIISDKESIEYFIDLYNTFKNKIEYFVLLPYISVGRAPSKEVDFDYIFKVLKNNKNINLKQIAFGAKFYPRIIEEKWLDISIYEPEIMSKYLDLNDMKLYKSSFETIPIKQIMI